MADIVNVTAKLINGYIQYTDTNGNVVANIFPSNLTVKTVTTAVSLTAADMGKDIRVTVSGTVVTLPVASTTTLPGGTFTVRNMTNNGGGVMLITVTGDSIIGSSISTSNLFMNTGATHVPGDSIVVSATGSSTWYAIGLTGTWASTS